MRCCYHEGYTVPLPAGHRFPMGKYAALYGILAAEGLLPPSRRIAPRPADYADLLLAHTPEYLNDLAAGTLPARAARRIGLPMSPEMVLRARLAVQGTINAALMALEDGIAANLAGGTHHAFPGHGEGFCILNDVGVAVRALMHARWCARVLVVDLDVHQGNGTAAMLGEAPGVYLLSMHGANNYPFHKHPSTLDLPLPDGAGDDVYLDLLAAHLPGALAAARPDLAFYLAGVDVVAGDRFGRLALTRAGLHRRERYVLQTLRDAGVPTALLLSGGYAPTDAQTADLHAVAHREARRIYGA